MIMVKIAVDPGASGAVVWTTDNGATVHSMDCPQSLTEQVAAVGVLATMARALGLQTMAVVEQVNCQSGEGVKSVWSFSGNYHTWLAAFAALGVPRVDVSPAKWQKEFGVYGKCKTPRLKATSAMGKDERKAVDAENRRRAAKDKTARKNLIKEKVKARYPGIRVVNANADALAMLIVFDKLVEV